jgi:hypothetical protein
MLDPYFYGMHFLLYLQLEDQENMRIIPFKDKVDLEDIDSLYIIVKAVPFEDGFVPATVVVSPDNNHVLSLDELHALMDGLEIAQERISEVIDFIVNSKTFGDPYGPDE